MADDKSTHVQEGMDPRQVAQAFTERPGTEQRGYNPQAISQALGTPPAAPAAPPSPAPSPAPEATAVAPAPSSQPGPATS